MSMLDLVKERREIDDLHKIIDATAMGICYHPDLRGQLKEKTMRDINTMVTALAERAFLMGKEAS